MKKYVKPSNSTTSATFEQRFIACVIARMLPNNVYQDGDDLCFDDGAFTASVCLNYNSAAASDCFYVTYKAADPYILDLSGLYDDVLNNIVKINPYLFLSKYDYLASIDISITSSITKNNYTHKVNSTDLQFYRRIAYFATGDIDYLTYGGVTDALLLNIMKLNKACEKLESSKGAPVIIHHKSRMIEGVPDDEPGQIVEEWDEKFETTDFVLNIKGFENHKFNIRDDKMSSIIYNKDINWALNDTERVLGWLTILKEWGIKKDLIDDKLWFGCTSLSNNSIIFLNLLFRDCWMFGLPGVNLHYAEADSIFRIAEQFLNTRCNKKIRELRKHTAVTNKPLSELRDLGSGQKDPLSINIVELSEMIGRGL